VGAPHDWLTRPLEVLNVGKRGFAPLTWRDEFGLTGLAFLDTALAQRHLARVRGAAPANGGARRPAPALLTLAGDDLRAREEWLRAVLAAGAARVAFDPLPGAPLQGELTAALLAEVLSYKRGLACL
jgi:alkylation response protein AidB-like acyl-CoA dehydrogenase